MNLFQVILVDVILLIFPILIYLLYLSTDKNINNKKQKLYLMLSLYASFYLLYKFSINTKFITLLLVSSILLLFFLEDMWQMGMLFSFVVLFAYMKFNCIYFLYIEILITLLFYYLRKKGKVSIIVFLEIYIFTNNIVFLTWVYLFNIKYLNLDLILLLIANTFITNIICQMYMLGKKILKTHFKYKKLQQEKQIRLSLFKITHEIKNPIAVIKGYLDMLDVRDSKQVKRYIPIIKSETDRILTILQDFLSLNKMNLDIDIMDINMMIEEVIFKLKSILKDKNIKLNLELLDDEIYINGDYNRLSQVFINIIKNSIEAIDEKGEINITEKIGEEYLEISIIDNGVGMTKEIIEKMKEPFYTTKSNGTGLGVSLIYEIIEAHKGKIKYKSEIGRGTKAIIKFPLYE